MALSHRIMDPAQLEQSSIALIPADILHHILSKLPFSQLLSLRVVSKRWNEVICSLYIAPERHIPKCVPVHFWNDRLTVYNSQTKAWDKHSLAFFQDHTRTTHLELAATAGGLMCFRTGKPNELIVCNPISRLWKLLQVPLRVGDETSDLKYMSPGFNFLAGDQQRSSSRLRRRTTIVGLVIDSATAAHYKIVVVSLQCNSASSNTVLYDSLTGSWKRGAKAPQGGEFSDGAAVLCSGSLYCLVKTETFNGELYKYDVKNDRWSTLSLDMSVMRCKLIEHCGRVILVKRNSYYSHDSAFRFFQLRRKGIQQSRCTTTRSVPVDTVTQDLSMQSLEETDLIESLNLDAVSVSKVLEHLSYTGRVCLLGQTNFLYVLKPPYEDGQRKRRTLVTIIDLTTGSCDVLREMIVASAAREIGYNHSAPEIDRIGDVFHLFSASVTVQV